MPLLAGGGLAALAALGLRQSEPPCAYVVEQVGTTSVATPAVPLTVPPEEARVWTCSLHGLSTPAVPIHLPSSLLDTPGTVKGLQALTLEFPTTRLQYPGHAILLSEDSLLLLPLPYRPKPELAQRPVSLSFQLKGRVRKAQLLLPPTPLPVTVPK
jgi:hypothetical protein